jgi:glutaredoxin
MSESAPAPASRRIPGIAILAVIGVFVVVQLSRNAVERNYCAREFPLPAERTAAEQADPAIPDVIMLGASWCTFCKAATRFFHDNGVHFCEYDIETTDYGRAAYEKLDGRGVPVILIGPYHLQGYDEGEVRTALSKQGLL